MKQGFARKIFKVFKIFAFSILGLLLLGFILFCSLVMNPFEADYKENLFALVPADSHLALYVPQPLNFYKYLSKTVAWGRLEGKNARFRVKKMQIYQRYKKGMKLLEKNRQKILQKIGIDILQDKYLREILGKEFVISFRRPPKKRKKRKFLILTHVSWKIKTIDGLVPYIPKKLKKKFVIQSKKIRQILVSKKGIYYWSMYRDVLFLSNDERYIRDSLALCKNTAHSLLETSQKLKDQVLFSKDSKGKNLFFYLDRMEIKNLLRPQKNPRKYKKKEKFSMEKFAKTIVPVDYITNGFGILDVSKDFQLAFSFILDRNQMQEDKYVLPKQNIQDYIYTQFPKNCFLYTSLSIAPKKIWNYFWPKISRGWKSSNYIQRIDQFHGEKDFIGKCFGRYFEPEVSFVFSHTDFLKEDVNLKPADVLPAGTFVFRAKKPAEFSQKLQSILQQIRKEFIAKNFRSQKTTFTFFRQQNHLGYKIVKFKYPDKTGGSIQPAIGFVDGYFLIASHISFIKDFIDVRNDMGGALKDTLAHQKISLAIQNDGNFKLFIHGDEVLVLLQKSKRELIERIVGAPKNRADWYRKQKVRLKWEKRFQKYCDFLRVFEIRLGLNIKIRPEEIEGQIILPFKFKE